MDFPKEEERILEFWREIDAFKTSVKLSEGRPPYSFYDGPPFCTGYVLPWLFTYAIKLTNYIKSSLPHYGTFSP